MSQDKPIASEVIQQPTTTAPSEVVSKATPKKKSNKLLIVALILIPLVLIICVVIVIAGLAIYKGYQETKNEIVEILPTDITVTTTIELPETNSKSFPTNKLTSRITPGVQLVPQGSYLEPQTMYYAEYYGKPLVFIYNEGPGNPEWIFEHITYIKASGKEEYEQLYLSDEQYLEFISYLDNVVKLATIDYDLDDDLTDIYVPVSPVTIVDATTNYEDTKLYISYITEIYNSEQGEIASGVLVYDFNSSSFDSFVQSQAQEIEKGFYGAYFFKAAEGDFVIASLTDCYACGHSDEATVVFNFADKKYSRLGNVVKDVYIDLEEGTVTLTHMEYAGQESEDCPDSCPVYDYGDEETFILP